MLGLGGGGAPAVIIDHGARGEREFVEVQHRPIGSSAPAPVTGVQLGGSLAGSLAGKLSRASASTMS
jgi:hypothetical protein